MMRVQTQCFLKGENRIVDSSFSRRNYAKIIPRIWQRVRIIGRKLHGAFENLARGSVLILIQVDASYAVQRLGARRIVAQRLLE